MSLPKEFTTVTTFSKYLALSLFIIFPIIGFYLGVYYQQAKIPQQIATQPLATAPALDNSNSPTIVSQVKNLNLNTTISPKMNATTVYFANSANTTYDKTIYHFKGSDFVVLDLHMSNPVILAQIQELDSTENAYLDFVYEGQRVNDAEILMKQLSQPVGFYPQTIYDGSYEIFTNKNGIKMKRQYSNGFGNLTDKVEFVSPAPLDDTYSYRYYSFESNDFILGTSFDQAAFSNSNNPILWIKSHPQKNLTVLNSFIDTIKNIGY